MILSLPLAFLTLTAKAQKAQSVPARVTSPVSNAQRTQLRGTTHYASLATADMGALSGDTPLKHMILALQPSADQEKQLSALLAAQTTPSAPQYHHWLTPAEFGQRFGVADQDIQAITVWLQSQGFTVEQIPAGRRNIVFSGTVAQLQSAFSTSLHRFQVNGQTRIANNADPSIPTALAPVIAGFVSLNDKPHTAAHHEMGTFKLDRTHGTVTQISTPASTQTEQLAEGVAQSSGSGITPNFNASINGGTYHIVAPYDFATIYNLKPLWNEGIDGTGQTIAIVSRSNLDLSDVDKFRANFGLPAAKVNKILVGDDPGVTSDVPETALDVEWSGAVAKGATIDLVIGGSSLTTDGTDASALYIVNNDVAPVMSMSYGECELAMGPAGNLFYKTLWQQAAAQGQTVFVSTGDAGATTCDQGGSYATLGLSVNGLASTPYNVAVGGTDLYGTYANTATSWGTTNDPTTLASALTYVQEIPWNDSCGNSVLLGVLQAHSGYTDTTTAQLCNDSKVNTSNFRTLAGGGGGASNCLDTTDGTDATCTGGYAKPSWQTGTGVPNDSSRDIPDVSLFAGDGLWGSFYPYCVGSLTEDGICDMTSSTDIQGAGGTSFASPAFAGIMALVNQKTSAIQGNANPVLYQLAASQNSMDCSVESGSANGNCVFHDVDLAGNATPCFDYEISKDCVVSTTGNIWGVVSGNAAGKGYDMASGLGSVNITNLVNNWSSITAAQSSTTTTLTLSSTTAAYGAGPTATIAVASSTGTPTGDVTVLASGQTGRQYSDPQATLSAGQASLTLSQLPVGTYPVTAHYAGDGSFASSDSDAQTITVSKAATTLTVLPTRTTVTPTTPSLLTLTIAAAGAGAAPTGTVSIVNTTTGVSLGSYTVQASSTAATATANADISSTQLQGGNNVLSLSYSGDDNYLASNLQQTLSVTSPLTIALSSSSLTLTAGGAATTATTTATIAAASGAALAYPITLACTGTLPSGASCSLSNSVLSSPTTTSTVTVAYNPLAAANTAKPLPTGRSSLPAVLAGLLAAFGLISRRKRVASITLLTVASVSLLFPIVGCGNSSTSSTLTLKSSTTSTTPGSPVTFSATLLGHGSSHPLTGIVTVNDSYLGSVRTLGSASVALDGTAAVVASSLGTGTHSVSALYAGDSTFPTASSSAVSITVSSSAALQITATDANGQKVAAPLEVTLQ
ncbi:MAG: Ig-like domain repeat protein [Acidobacteriaceae bacterium]|nr:Ig-like domain repeat protein [Acidobacteriaceae bacterium]